MELLPAKIIQSFVIAIVSGFTILHLFPATPQNAQRDFFWTKTPRLSWFAGIFISTLSYLFFYFFFGALNYELFTKPYYEGHNALEVPEIKTVLVAETIRAVLIIFSIIPFLSVLKDSRKLQILNCGFMLFVIGGIVPLIMQVGTLPSAFLLASGIEIFFQNFSTGLIAALMLGSHRMYIKNFEWVKE